MGINVTSSFITDNYEEGLQFIQELTEQDQLRLENYDAAAIFEMIDKKLEAFQDQRSKMIDYYERYTGKSVPIYSRQYPEYIKETEKNKIHNDFEGEIVDTKTSYLFSNPVTRRVYKDEGQEMNPTEENINEFDVNNNMQDMDAEICKMSACVGYGASLMYISKKPWQFERLMELSPWEVVFVNDSFGDLVYAIRYWAEETINNKTLYKIELYDKTNIIYIDGHMGYKITGIQPHGFDEIPVFMAQNNKELRSDIDKVVDLIDSYDYAISDYSNEITGNRNALMVAKNADLTVEETKKINESGALNLPEDGDVYYLTKDMKNDAYLSYYEKLEDNIARFSGTPDFTRTERTGNLTNLGISFLYSKLEIRAGIFKRKFTTYLDSVYRCLQTSLVKRGKEFDWKSVDYIYTENKPYNEKEAAEVQEKLVGKFSEVTRLSQHPRIDDAVKEKEALQKDQEEAAKRETAAFNFGEGNETTVTETTTE